jgi:hypothetical protein
MNNFLLRLNELQIGDRIVVPKSKLEWVQHHAIYLGIENGQHLIIENKEGFGVRVVTAAIFFYGVSQITRIEKFYPRPGYNRNDLYHFALSKRGKSYHLINYNCETFCNEVQHHKIASRQSNIGVGLGILAGVALIAGLSSLNKKK